MYIYVSVHISASWGVVTHCVNVSGENPENIECPGNLGANLSSCLPAASRCAKLGRAGWRLEKREFDSACPSGK